MKKNKNAKERLEQLDENSKLNNIGKNEIIKDYKKNGKIKTFIDLYFEKWELDVNEIIFGINNEDKIDLKHLSKIVDINKLVEKLVLNNVMFQHNNGEVITSLYYSLHNYEIEILVELDEKLKLRNIDHIP